MKTKTIAMVVAVLAAAGGVHGRITFNGFVSWTKAAGNGTYDARGSDKLVVVISGEHNFNQSGSGRIYGVTYDGQAMTKAVYVLPTTPVAGVNYLSGVRHGDTTTAIYYLDNPGAYHTLGTIAPSVEGNNYVYTAMGLSNTSAGVGSTASITMTSNVNLTTAAANSMVIFNVAMGGAGNTGDTTTVPTLPAGSVKIAGMGIGRSSPNHWASHNVARASIDAVGTSTFSFNTAKDDIVTLAAEFKAGPPLSTVLLVR